MKNIINKIGLFFSNIIQSFNNKQDSGFSARKCTAFAAVLMGAYITKYRLPSDAQLHALYAWQMLALMCLGIVTIEQVIRLKNGTSQTKETVLTQTENSLSKTDTVVNAPAENA